MKRVLLGEIAKISSGGTPSRTNSSFWGGAIPWVKTGEIQFNCIRDSEEKITPAAIKGSAAKVYPRNTLLLAMYGQGKTRGQVAILGMDAAINQACAAIEPETPGDERFLFQYLSFNYHNIRRLSNAGSQENLSADIIRSIPVVYPGKPERTKSADILSTWDEALEKLDALIAAKDRRKQSLMQQLLTGRKRVKGAKGKWKKMQLGDLAGNQSNQNKGKLGTECLYGVTKADGVVPMREHVKGESFHRCKMLEHDWFAYNPMRINIGSIARWQGNKRIMVSGDYVVFRCFEDRLSPAYLDQLRKSWMWQSFVTQGGNGSVRIRIYFSDLAEFTFPCPPIEEQRQIAAILDTADQELTLLRTQRNALDQQKRGLMQRLLTGRIRVAV